MSNTLVSSGRLKCDEISTGTTGSPSSLGILLPEKAFLIEGMLCRTISPSSVWFIVCFDHRRFAHPTKSRTRSFPKLNSFVDAHADGAPPVRLNDFILSSQ